MLVTLKGFGGIWEKRLRDNPAVPDVAARVAYYNTTGVLVDGKIRYRWRIGGKIRFNGIGGFTPTNPVRVPEPRIRVQGSRNRPWWLDPSAVSEKAGLSGTTGSLSFRGDGRAHGTSRRRIVLEVGFGSGRCLERITPTNRKRCC